MVRRVSFLLIAITALAMISVAGATTLLTNSHDWRVTYLGIEYGQLHNYSTLVMSSLGDAEAFSKILAKNSSIVVFEDGKSNVIHDGKKFFELKGFTNVSSVVVSDPLSYQLKLAKAYPRSCTIVIPDKFMVDLLSAAPYAMIHNCTLLMWDYAHSEEILNYLRSYHGHLIFFGDIPERPWVLFNNSEVIRGSMYDINREMVKRVLDYYKSKGVTDLWVVLVQGNLLELGSITEKKPILVYSGDVEETTKFLLNNGVYHIEGIGPSIFNIVARIRDASHKEIGAVVKFGRTFAGIPGLQGVVVPLNGISGSLPRTSLSLYEIVLDRGSGKLVLVLRNTGNTRLLFSVPALNLKSDGQQVASLSDNSVYTVLPGQYFSLPFNLPSGSYSNVAAYLYAIYGQSEPLSKHVGSGTPPVRFNVTLASFSDHSNVSIVSARYFVKSGKIVVDIKNIGSVPTYAYGELMNFTYGNNTVVMAPLNYTYIQPGKVGELVFPTFLSSKELTENRNISIKLFYGEKYPVLMNSKMFTAELNPYSPGVLSAITGMLVAVLASPVFYVALVIIILVVILWKKQSKSGRGRRSRKHRRGSVRL